MKTSTMEDMLQQIDAIVQQLETPDLSLEESIKLYKQGVELSDVCKKKLEQARCTIEEIHHNGEVHDA